MKKKLHSFSLSCLSLIFFQQAFAQWSTDATINNAVCTQTNNQNGPIMISDGGGGAIMTWHDDRNGNMDIYAQRVNSSGAVQWTATGIGVCTATGDQLFPGITTDGAGGAIITWQDSRNGNNDIYAQRINSSGVAQWTANGVAICTATDDDRGPSISSDGAGGAIIAWTYGRIYAQRINSSGSVQWTVNGVAICTSGGNHFAPGILADGSGSYFIHWYSGFGGSQYDIFAQKINNSGVVQWTTNGVGICTAGDLQANQDIALDGAGGAIFAWQDRRNGSTSDTYVQRINSSGVVQWTANGVSICSASFNQDTPKITADGSGGAIISWQDYRAGSGTSDIYAQRINSSGAAQWTVNGLAICTATGNQQIEGILTDGSGGAIIIWRDARSGAWDIYVQRLNGSGAGQWAANGLGVATAANDQVGSSFIVDGTGGAILSWRDFRSGAWDIYAQLICPSGVLGLCNLSWTGSTSTAWATASNWNSGIVPLSTDNIIIPNVANDPVISTGIQINNVDLNSGATLTVSNGGSLTLNGALSNAGAITIQSGGSFLQGGSSSISGAGTFTVQRQGTASTTRFNYWSTPVVNGTVPGTNGYQYISSEGTNTNADDNPGPDPGWSSFSGTMTAGRGYASTGGNLASFTGTPGNGAINSAVTFYGLSSTSALPNSDFVLLGNPYPSGLTVNTFLTDNSARLTGQIWAWDDDNSNGTGYTTSDYASRTTAGSTSGGNGNSISAQIGSCQGFMAKAISSGTVSYTNAQRNAAAGTFLKTEEETSRIWLSLSNDTMYNEINVVFMDGATSGFDNMLDGQKLRGNAHIAFAVKPEGTTAIEDELCIAALPPVTEEILVPLTAFVANEGIYTIRNKAVENMGNTTVYIEDRLTGVFTNLDNNEAYPALMNEENTENRFFLHFAPMASGVNENKPVNPFITYINGSELVVLLTPDVINQQTQYLTLTDLSGKTILNQNIQSQGSIIKTAIPHLSAGMYVISVHTANNVYSGKAIVK